MHYFYILYSPKRDRFYIGETSDLIERLKKHNNKGFKKAYTKITNDWEYILTFETTSRTEALYLENFLKRMKSRKFIQKIIDDNNILSDILEKK